MNLDKIDICPGALAKGFNTYSPICLKYMFNGKKVNYILPYNSSQKDKKNSTAIFRKQKNVFQFPESKKN